MQVGFRAEDEPMFSAYHKIGHEMCDSIGGVVRSLLKCRAELLKELT